ncbi:acetaldehyde dehydrogenase domain protein, partial [Desulfosporosinus sp. OT]
NIKRVAYGIKDFTENTTPTPSACVAQSGSSSAISDDQIMNVVNEVITLLKKRGGN